MAVLQNKIILMLAQLVQFILRVGFHGGHEKLLGSPLGTKRSISHSFLKWTEVGHKYISICQLSTITEHHIPFERAKTSTS